MAEPKENIVPLTCKSPEVAADTHDRSSMADLTDVTRKIAKLRRRLVELEEDRKQLEVEWLALDWSERASRRIVHKFVLSPLNKDEILSIIRDEYRLATGETQVQK